MPTENDVNDQLELLHNHRQILQISLLQLAGLNPLYAPPGLIKTIEDERDQIRQLKQILRSWGTIVENLPNEEPTAPAQAISPDQQLYEALLRLDYRDQELSFFDYVDHNRAAAFLIHGASPQYGQRWLLNRLLRQRVSTTDKVLPVDLYRKTRGTDLSDLWREMCRRVGLAWPQPIGAIAERVGGWLKTQSVVLIFDNAEALLQGGITEFVEDFWRPLVKYAQGAPQAGPHQLLMFLIDNDGKGDACSAPLAEPDDLGWQPHQPIKLPAISRFSTDLLGSWIEIMGTALPPPFRTLRKRSEIQQIVGKIVAQGEQGLPLETMITICEQCDCHWYEKEAVWLKY